MRSDIVILDTLIVLLTYLLTYLLKASQKPNTFLPVSSSDRADSSIGQAVVGRYRVVDQVVVADDIIADGGHVISGHVISGSAHQSWHADVGGLAAPFGQSHLDGAGVAALDRLGHAAHDRKCFPAGTNRARSRHAVALTRRLQTGRQNLYVVYTRSKKLSK